MSIIDNLQVVKRNVVQAACRVGRDPKEVQIVAVTKTVAVEKIKVVIDKGIISLGENRAQELIQKKVCLPATVKWHFIGHLQKNKVKKIVGEAELIHSVDSWQLACEINRHAEEKGIIADVLIQVNVSGEKSKFGVEPGEAVLLADKIASLAFVRLKGLMTIAPFVEDPEETRPVFNKTRKLADKIKTEVQGVDMGILSMGMTNDYEVAIEEGATLVRVGSAIFGARSQ